MSELKKSGARSESKKPAVDEVFVVEKIIDKRRKRNNKVEYLVVWEGHPGKDSWEPISSFKGHSDAIDDFESTYMPPRCAKKGGKTCSCGDTGCDGPNAVRIDLSASSSSNAPPAAGAIVPPVAAATIPDPPPPRAKLKHPILVPGDGKHLPPAQSLLAKKLPVVDVQLNLEEKKPNKAH